MDPGSSLYGNYWVDRPPLLIAVFAGAGTRSVVAPRLGCWPWRWPSRRPRVGWHASGRYRGRASRLSRAAFLATPPFGTRIVDGELRWPRRWSSAVWPRCSRRPEPGSAPARWCCGLAGGLGAAAFLVKQDMVDVFVVVAVLAGARDLAPWRPHAAGTCCPSWPEPS